jgi:hypothetical protein
MFYVLYKTPTSQIIIGDSDLSAANEVLPVSLCGHDYVGEYGQVFQNNLYYLLENFNSGDTVPVPTAGMLWYDDKNYNPPILKLYTTENKWKKIDFLIDDAGVVEFTGSRYVGKQLTATLKDINNPTNISWAWFLNNTAFTQDGVVLDEISSTIITTGSGTYKAIATYDDDFNQSTSANNIVTIDDLAVDSPGALDVTGSMKVGSPITATLIDLDTPVRVKWTWTDDNQSLVTSTNKGLDSIIIPDKAGSYTVLVEYYDSVNTANPVSLQDTVTVVAKADDDIGYVTLTGDLIINTPLTATLHDDDPITGDIQWIWIQDTNALPAVSDTGKTSVITPTTPGTYVAQALYVDSNNPNGTNAQAHVEITEFATTTRVTTRYVPTTTSATGGSGNCCCNCGLSGSCNKSSHSCGTNSSCGTSNCGNTNGGTTPTTNTPVITSTTQPVGTTQPISSTTAAPASSTTTTTTLTPTSTTTTTTTPGGSTPTIPLLPTNNILYGITWAGDVDLDTIIGLYSNGVLDTFHSAVHQRAIPGVTWSDDVITGSVEESYTLDLSLVTQDTVVLGIMEYTPDAFTLLSGLETRVHNLDTSLDIATHQYTTVNSTSQTNRTQIVGVFTRVVNGTSGWKYTRYNDIMVYADVNSSPWPFVVGDDIADLGLY